MNHDKARLCDHGQTSIIPAQPHRPPTTMAQVLLFLFPLALQLAAGFLASPQPSRVLAIRGATDWDRLIREDEDEDLVFEYGDRAPPPRDMKYSMYNINRQREHYNLIREVSSKVSLDTDVRFFRADVSDMKGHGGTQTTTGTLK